MIKDWTYFSLRFDPIADLTHQFTIILHMFEHFNRNDSISLPMHGLWEVESLDISRIHHDVLEASCCRRSHDILTLGVAVANRRDLALGIFSRQIESYTAICINQVLESKLKDLTSPIRSPNQ